jgi:hypothetical protein
LVHRSTCFLKNFVITVQMMDQVLQMLDRLLEPVGLALDGPAARKLLSLRADSQTQARMDELAERCTEGELTSDEQIECESLVSAAGMIAILQAKARKVLATPPAA